MKITEATVKPLLAWIYERHLIWEKRARRRAYPWTDDPILGKFRFCNVYREQDKVTQWIAKYWRKPLSEDVNMLRDDGPGVMIFWMAVARYVNRINTLNEITMMLHNDWRPNEFKKRLHMRQAHGEQVFGAAYIVSTNGVSMDKIDYVADVVLSPLWKTRNKFVCGVPLARIYDDLRSGMGVGSFMAGQIIADIKYAPQFRGAKDWWTWSTPGPGSKRGLNRLLGRDKDTPIRAWAEEMAALLAVVAPAVEKKGMPRIHAQDLQNCLCEFDKYERVRKGEGTPKQLYTPQTGVLV